MDEMAESATLAEPELCRFVKFTQRVVHRRELKNAPYNPRLIQKVSREKLKKNLKTRGLLNAPVWNQRTGNLVSGHQRIAILDQLMRTDNYLIPVDVVDLSEKEEMEQNVFFNNRDSQGDFDQKLLKELIAAPTFDSEAAGFDLSEVVERFGEDTLAASSEKLQALSAALERAKARNEEIKSKSDDAGSTGFYRVVVFKDQADADRLAEFNEEHGCIFLHGGRLLQRMGIKKEENDDG